MNRACILICGLERSFSLVIERMISILTPQNYSCHFILCLYSNQGISNEMQKYMIQPCVLKTILLPNQYDSFYRNTLNLTDKIKNAIVVTDPGYDLYILLRSDTIVEQIDISSIDASKLYFSAKKMNQFIDYDNQLDESIILTKSFDLFFALSKLHDFNLENTNYINKVLYNFMYQKQIPYNILDIEYKYVLTKCNVIAIAGDSGSGKSTLLKAIEQLFDERVTLETDRYHKWERGDSNYEKYTHLNPHANHLEKMYEDVYNLKIGNDIHQVDYDHNTGKFTQKQKIESKTNIVLCGLHTLYNTKQLVDLKIYVDTDRELIKKWKVERDVLHRGYSINKVLESIEKREPDYHAFIYPQMKDADIVVNFYLKNGETKCNLIVHNLSLVHKLVAWLKYMNYDIYFGSNGEMTIPLKNTKNIIENTAIEKYELDKYCMNTYYIEIQTILFYILFQ